MDEKPISLIINDTRKAIADIVNKSSLPICIIESILKDLYNESSILAKQQLELDKKAYAEKQKEEKE